MVCPQGRSDKRGTITVVTEDVDAVLEPSHFKFLLAISRRPVTKQSFLHFAGRTRCDWNVILASGESQHAETNRDAESPQPS
jgi:hypothetical protein